MFTGAREPRSPTQGGDDCPPPSAVTLPHNASQVFHGFVPRAEIFTPRLNALDDGRDRLAEADAHRGQPVAAVAPLELVQQRRGDARPCRAERMAERDAPAVRVHVLGALLEPCV